MDINRVENFTREFDSCRTYHRLSDSLQERRQKLIASFATWPTQSIDLKPSIMTKEQIAAIAARAEFKSLSIRVADAPRAKEIRSTARTMEAVERLKPRNCNCYCRVPKGDTISVFMKEQNELYAVCIKRIPVFSYL